MSRCKQCIHKHGSGKRLHILGCLPNADEAHRYADTIGNGEKNATLRTAIQLCDGKTGQAKRFVELLSLYKRVLTLARIEHQHHLMRSRFVTPGDDTLHFDQLVHEAGLTLESPRSVGEQDIHIARPRSVHRVKYNRCGIGARLLGNDRNVVAIAPGLKLLNRGGTKCVACSKHDGITLVLETTRKLADRCCLAGAVHPDHENDVRTFWLVDRQWYFDRLQNVAQRLMQASLQRFDILEFFPGEALLEIRDYSLGRIHPDIRHDKQALEFLKDIFIDCAAWREIGEVVRKPAVTPVNASAQAFDEPFGSCGLFLFPKHTLRFSTRGEAAMAKRKQSDKSKGGRLRIVAGNWRSRLLDIADVEGLRPTTERIRETLFNWLEPTIHGARCLDLFAGTGALGLEALSRGAGSAVFVERSPVAARQLASNVDVLDASDAIVLQRDALDFLRGEPERTFDIVFLDPPFAADLLEETCRLLAEREWLAPGARVYLEQDRANPESALPESWQVLRDKTAGNVRYMLAQVGEDD